MSNEIMVRDPLEVELARDWNLPAGAKFGEAFEAALGVSNLPVPLRLQFLFLCKDHGLNPMRREIWAFQTSKGLAPMVSIDGWLSILRRQEDYLSHGLAHGKDDLGQWCEVTIQRKGRPDFKHRCYHHEWVQDRSPVWKARPLHMLGVRTTCQGIRMCYGIGGIHIEGDQEIMASRTEQVRNIAADAVVSGGYDDPVPELKGLVVEPDPEPDYNDADRQAIELTEAGKMASDEIVDAMSQAGLERCKAIKATQVAADSSGAIGDW